MCIDTFFFKKVGKIIFSSNPTAGQRCSVYQKIAAGFAKFEQEREWGKNN